MSKHFKHTFKTKYIAGIQIVTFLLSITSLLVMHTNALVFNSIEPPKCRGVETSLSADGIVVISEADLSCGREYTLEREKYEAVDTVSKTTAIITGFIAILLQVWIIKRDRAI